MAALVALLELTANPHIILPGMLAIVSANLAAKELFGKCSVFLSQMRAIGLDYRNDPIAQSLRRIGVASVMDRSFVSTEREISREQAESLISGAPLWVLINYEGGKLLMPASDLARYLGENDEDRVDQYAGDAARGLRGIPRHCACYALPPG